MIKPGDRVVARVNVALFGESPKIVERPADVVVVGADHACNLNVILDGPNDTNDQRYGAPATRWFGNVPHDPVGQKAPSWRPLER